jgi:hypothetical protein
MGENLAGIIPALPGDVQEIGDNLSPQAKVECRQGSVL